MKIIQIVQKEVTHYGYSPVKFEIYLCDDGKAYTRSGDKWYLYAEPPVTPNS